MMTLEVQRQAREAPLRGDPSTADETLIIITADRMWGSKHPTRHKTCHFRDNTLHRVQKKRNQNVFCNISYVVVVKETPIKLGRC